MEPTLKLSMRVCTWNVGNAPPHWDLSEWLGMGGPEYDIIAVGAQEANFKEKDAESHGVPVLDTDEFPQGDPSEPSASSSSKSGLRKIRKKITGRGRRGPKDDAAKEPTPKSTDTADDTSRQKRHSSLSATPSKHGSSLSAPVKRGSSIAVPVKNLSSQSIPSKTSSTSSLLNNITLPPRADAPPRSSLPQRSGVPPLTNLSATEEAFSPISSPKNPPDEKPRQSPRRRFAKSMNLRSALLDAALSHPTGSPPPAEITASSSDSAGPSSSSDSSLGSDSDSSSASSRIFHTPRTASFSSSSSTSSSSSPPSNRTLLAAQQKAFSQANDSPPCTTPPDPPSPNRTLGSELRRKFSRGIDRLSLGPSTDELRLSRAGTTSEGESAEPPTPHFRTATSLTRPRALGLQEVPAALPHDASSSSSSHAPPVPSASSPGHWKFSKCVQKSVGPQYVLAAKHHLMEMKLLVFVHRRLQPHIGRAGTSSEATGIGNVVGNKGAVAATLEIGDTTLCFVNAHLAAHEGAKFLQQRHADASDILRHLEKHTPARGSTSIPSIHQFSHIIWMGDLNYRLDLSRGLPKAAIMSHAEQIAYVHAAVARGDLQSLRPFDELRCEMAKDAIFSGFREGPLDFPPTFKTLRGSTTSVYQTTRVPSYTDRILFRSLPKHRDHLSLTAYSSIPTYCTSDHKPVYATFKISIPQALHRFGKSVPSSAIKATLDFHSLRLSGLYEKRTTPAIEYDILEDGALSVRHLTLDPFPPTPTTPALAAYWPDDDGDAPTPSPATTHTRRGVRAEFHGHGVFLRDKAPAVEVPLTVGGVRAVGDSALPCIALAPLVRLADLRYKYVAVVFSRWGSKVASSCLVSLGDVVDAFHQRRPLKATLELTKYGQAIASVEVEVELCVSTEAWVDSGNRVVKKAR